MGARSAPIPTSPSGRGEERALLDSLEYTPSLARIADQLADNVGLCREHRGQPGGELLEAKRRRNQRIERRIAEESKRRGKPTPGRPANAMRGRDPAHLA